MKNYFFLLFVFFLTNMCVAQSILFSPKGEMDKPLPTIELVITPNNRNVVNKTEKRGKVRVYVMSVSYDNFISILKIVDLNNTQVSFDEKTNYSYGSYEIRYEKGNKQLSYIIITREKSSIFFKKLLSFTKPNDYLYQEFSELIRRLY
ncbi:hypothetical protein ACHRV5_11020 [Flavobacterium sp. FlaQc-52]|uniref:hypothetical protein n=1 Tax=Flavobacterium sp. FlaQc-52 TaxID=3374185 RepID=UPI0037570A23